MEHLRLLSILFTIIIVTSVPSILANEKTHIQNEFTRENEEIDKTVVYMPESDMSTIVQLPFDFEVFGHNVKEVEVLREGGIRSTDPNLRWSAIPLRINTFGEFTPCPIRHRFEGGSLTIQWEFGYHHCKNRLKLSFQLKIQDSGLIYFVYKKIPFGNLKNARFRNIYNNFGLNYEYKVPGTNDTFTLGPQLNIHEVDINNTTIMVQPLPLCANFHDRRSCLVDAQYLSHPLSCFWCPAIGICSSKSDFLQNVWRDNGCEPLNGFGPGEYIPEDANQRMFVQGLALGILITCFLIFYTVLIYSSR